MGASERAAARQTSTGLLRLRRKVRWVAEPEGKVGLRWTVRQPTGPLLAAGGCAGPCGCPPDPEGPVAAALDRAAARRTPWVRSRLCRKVRRPARHREAGRGSAEPAARRTSERPVTTPSDRSAASRITKGWSRLRRTCVDSPDPSGQSRLRLSVRWPTEPRGVGSGCAGPSCAQPDHEKPMAAAPDRAAARRTPTGSLRLRRTCAAAHRTRGVDEGCAGKCGGPSDPEGPMAAGSDRAGTRRTQSDRSRLRRTIRLPAGTRVAGGCCAGPYGGPPDNDEPVAAAPDRAPSHRTTSSR